MGEILEAEHRVNTLLHASVILLYQVVQVFARPDLHPRTQRSLLLQFSDSSMCRWIAIERNPLRGAVLPCGSCKEPLGGSNISVFAQQEIDCEILLIDCSVEVCPPASNSDVRFICSPRSTDRSCVVVPELLELRDDVSNLSQDSRMRDIDAALGHHSHQVSGAKLVSGIPTDAENDDCAIKLATTKQGP